MSREKLFGYGKCVPLDREAKIRLLKRAEAMLKPTQRGKHYGRITAKAFAVLKALLYGFHNSKTGRCFPSYEKIAELAGCARSTVHESITRLEDAGLLTWHHRLKRVRGLIPSGSDLFGAVSIIRVERTSNAYRFLVDGSGSYWSVPEPRETAKSEHPSGTSPKILLSIRSEADSAFQRAIERANAAIRRKSGTA